MNGRRILIGIVMLGVVHNALRVIASILGAQWGYFNYLNGPRNPVPLDFARGMEIFGVVAVVGLLILFMRALWRRAVGPSSAMWSSSIWALLAAIPLGLLAVMVSTSADKTYGWMLFVITPFLMGMVATLALANQRPITLGDALVVSLLSVLLLGGVLMALAVEGVICLGMAVPIALIPAIIGGAVGYAISGKKKNHGAVTALLIIGIAPFGGTIESALQPGAELFAVSTSIEIAAPPQRVWQTVLQPAKLAMPADLMFRAGVAYPLASHIEGAGPSATRYCDFSTGKLVEPVLLWNEPTQLRFTVASNPLPMQEWTPYARIHPPHLEGFLVSRQGEFKLEPLANGGTRLVATTWYQHHLWPSRYWQLWSDHIIHSVHRIVLQNVSDRALAYK